MNKVCLISYYFRPYKGVGAFRLSYWYDRLKEDGYEVTVFTATPFDNTEDSSIIRLPLNEKNASLFSDKSLKWGIDNRQQIKDYLNNNKDAIIIISGGPFLHVLPLITLKRQFKNSRWIIDYRDPLSRNPRNFSSGFIGRIKYYVKCLYEKTINSYADAVITVNEVCKKMVLSKNVYIIDNGYDERKFATHFDKNSSDKIVYAGKLSYINSIEPILHTISNLPSNYTFDYIGPDNLPLSSDRMVSHGFRSYDETMELLKKSSIGLILTTGKSFESTTKVFDYFAAQLKILIITCGEPKTGTLYEITKNNPNVEWAKDTPDDIKTAITKLQRPYQSWDYKSYSRSFGYDRLLALINKIS